MAAALGENLLWGLVNSMELKYLYKSSNLILGQREHLLRETVLAIATVSALRIPRSDTGTPVCQQVDLLSR